MVICHHFSVYEGLLSKNILCDTVLVEPQQTIHSKYFYIEN